VNKLNAAVLALAIAGAGLGARAGGLPVYADAGGQAPPKAAKDLGYVSAAVCTFQENDEAGQAAVLSQLRARAALRGADAIVHLRLVVNTNLRSSCWHKGYAAIGEAVSLH